jgi:hypothetical protein
MAGIPAYLRKSGGSVPSYQQRLNFRDRLHYALRNAGYRPNENTQLARDFNALHDGAPVGIASVHRWLSGDAIPSDENLAVLARLLDVSPAFLRGEVD